MMIRHIPAVSLTAAALSLMVLSNQAFAQQATQGQQPAQTQQPDSNAAAPTVNDQK